MFIASFFNGSPARRWLPFPFCGESLRLRLSQPREDSVIPRAQALHRETSSTSRSHSFLLGEETGAESRGFFGVVVFPSVMLFIIVNIALI